jgi:mannose/fructose/N-acetylgalactosamine-specific phosphotransferase system component IIC
MGLSSTGIMFISCLILGAGIGLFLGNLEMGGSIGLGAGLISIVVFRKK